MYMRGGGKGEWEVRHKINGLGGGGPEPGKVNLFSILSTKRRELSGGGEYMNTSTDKYIYTHK